MPDATIICCDCSEYMRNGDFYPSRFSAQADAIRLTSNCLMEQNIENTVGLVAMRPNQKNNVVINCSKNIGSIVSSLDKIKIGNSLEITDNDTIDIISALKTAKLALKCRLNKKQNQRIIIFIGSPKKTTLNNDKLLKFAKQLKKK
eukprot:765589_1